MLFNLDNHNQEVKIELNIPPTVQNKNSAFLFLLSDNLKTPAERKTAEILCRVANKYGWYLGDFISAVNEVSEEYND